jgi:hypothetical protein
MGGKASKPAAMSARAVLARRSREAEALAVSEQEHIVASNAGAIEAPTEFKAPPREIDLDLSPHVLEQISRMNLISSKTMPVSILFLRPLD